MADIVIDPPLRRVLECVSEEYKTVDEISEIHHRRHPFNIELVIRFSNAVRGRVFNEKKQKQKIPSVEKSLSELYRAGFLERMLTDFYLEALPERTKFYRLNNEGRSALFALSNKRR